MSSFVVACGLLSGGVSPCWCEDEKSGLVDDYNQWKQALGTNRATDPRSITAPPGFVVDLLRSARSQEGSWISLAFDPRGRILVAREDRGVLRLTLTPPAANSTTPVFEAPMTVETVNDTLLECRGMLWGHDSLYVNANNSKGFYRLKYREAEDRFEEPQLLRATPGQVGHGRNDLALGPDGDIYLIHGDDVSLPVDYRPEDSPLRNYFDDRLLPCSWDDQLFNASMKLPGGHVVRTDREGKKWEVVAGGLRNPYGIDFNVDGELFTFDADMEWDVGMPWYRPTRVLHLVSGADFGWRRGTGTWRNWYPDSLPAVADVGLGSPTAIRFGTRSQFPDPYQQALFILDWAYGRIFSVHLKPTGATYHGDVETFLTGRPLNVTDIEFGPDGAMYFLTGGRKTQSGLYRVRFTGSPTPAAKTDPEQERTSAHSNEARQLRHQLETFHKDSDPNALKTIWPQLGSDDPWIRHAARVALEQQPIGGWRDRVNRDNENPLTTANALLALARIGIASDRDVIVTRALSLPWSKLTGEQLLIVVRALAIAIARHGSPQSAEIRRLVAVLESRYPDESTETNQLVCELLVALKSSSVARKTLPLIATAKTQEEKFHYLVTLRHVRESWTLAERRTYIEWMRQAHDFYGAQYLPRYLEWLKSDVAASFTEQERLSFAELLQAKPPAAVPSPIVNRAHVRNWQLDDLAGSLDSVNRGRDFHRGQKAFADALCIRCHRIGQSGSPVGPDLTDVSRRFGRRDLLLSILAPSHFIDEKYRATTVVTNRGQVIVGQLSGTNGGRVTILPDLLHPEATVQIRTDEIETQTPALASTMPAGLLNTFSKEEILDLLAYLESSGRQDHSVFRSEVKEQSERQQQP